jgi:phosphoenolpyruvate carboxylase
VSTELQSRIEQYQTLLSGSQTLTSPRHDRMPYRVFLGQIMERLRATYDGRQGQYEFATQFLADLNIIHDSLVANKGEHAGAFQVRRLIRRARTFGFHLATLDIRQSSSVHRAVVGQGLGDPLWAQRTSDERCARLRDALERDESALAVLDATGKRSLWVFEALAHARHRNGPEAIGPYVVSSTRGVDDVLSVLLLARWADIADRRSGDVPVDVAPLFESAEALTRCGEVFRQMLNDPLYRKHLQGRGNHQYVMLGYSASNKDVGLAMSRWLVRKAQEAVLATAAEAGIDVTLFHGQGGSFGRGGARTEALVRSAPEGANRGRMRITEAGELINEKYGLRSIALRIFEQAFNALALASSGVEEAENVDQRWREVMDMLGEQSARAYRSMVFEDAEFSEFFRQLTPIDVIEKIQIGSRPTTRNERTGIAALRSIPWNYAWSQCRYMVPGWFGVGTALAAAREHLGAEVLAEMYQRWFFFQNLIDDVELALARADLGIAKFYDDLVEPRYRRFIDQIRAEFELTRQQILLVKCADCLLVEDATVQRSIRLRSPYIDPMHMLQVDLLRRWRADDRQDKDMLSALLASITGISQALQGA